MVARCPGLALGPEVLQILDVVGVLHGPVGLRVAEVFVLGEEGFIPAVEEVHLGEGEVGVFVSGSILLPQEPREKWSALGRKLAMEDDNVSLLGILLLLTLANLWLQQLFYNVITRKQVDCSNDMSSFVFIWIPITKLKIKCLKIMFK